MAIVVRVVQVHVAVGFDAVAQHFFVVAPHENVWQALLDVLAGDDAVVAVLGEEFDPVLEPVLVKAGIRPEHTAVIGTIKGDLHDIGKNLVAMMWKGANIEVIDLGTNVTPERFVEAAREHGAHLVGISALLTTTMVGMKDVVAAIRAANLPDVKVIVGGAPLTSEFAASIGADGYASDAASAVEAARKAMRGD